MIYQNILKRDRFRFLWLESILWRLWGPGQVDWTKQASNCSVIYARVDSAILKPNHTPKQATLETTFDHDTLTHVSLMQWKPQSNYFTEMINSLHFYYTGLSNGAGVSGMSGSNKVEIQLHNFCISLREIAQPCLHTAIAICFSVNANDSLSHRFSSLLLLCHFPLRFF